MTGAARATVRSPIGLLTLASDGEVLTELRFGPDSAAETAVETTETKPIPCPVLAWCMRELAAYFTGELRAFTVPFRAAGTPFREKVWSALCGIPYGETRSYRDIAAAVGNVKAVRAVGGANHHNPIAIIVPCHRVVGTDGSLTGFGGGLETKKFLLELEKRI